MQESVGYLLAQLCKAHRNAAQAALSELGMHVGQEMVLLRLWTEQGVTQSELAEQLCVEAPTVTRMLQRMERDGLIVRRSDPDDARLSRVYPAERGVALKGALEEAWAALEAQTLRGFTLEERLLLRRLLLQMQQNLSS